MYLYLYAPFLRAKKYARDLALLEGRITDFGIAGKIAQLSQFLKLPAAVKEFGMKKLDTVVVVGDDTLLDDTVNLFALSNVVVAYIPMVESEYGGALHIPEGIAAADVLAARRIAKLDLGRVGERFFLGSLHCEGKTLEIHSPTFSVFSQSYISVDLVNLGEGVYPDQGALTARITPVEGSMFKKSQGVQSVLKLQSCRLKSGKPLSAKIGAQGVLKLPLQVDSSPKAIRMVVGRRVRKMKN